MRQNKSTFHLYLTPFWAAEIEAKLCQKQLSALSQKQLLLALTHA
jgi:hypothetical protein